MSKIRKIQDLGYCRNCINKTLGLDLDKNDVLVYVYPERCDRCGRMKQVEGSDPDRREVVAGHRIQGWQDAGRDDEGRP